jgi:hypothetical protein
MQPAAAAEVAPLDSGNRSVNEFDVYVGTSAGAFVAALTANGATPEEMMRVVDDDAPEAFPELDHGIAVEAGARFVVVINPLVPHVGAYQRLHELARSWERRYPGWTSC